MSNLVKVGGCAQRVRVRKGESVLKVIKSSKTLNSTLERILNSNHFLQKVPMAKW
jgi:hypothetical protein